MGAFGGVVLAAVAAAVLLTAVGAFTRRRSVPIAAIALLVATLAAGLAWYAWAESRSAGWAAGYGAAALASAAVATRHLSGRH